MRSAQGMEWYLGSNPANLARNESPPGFGHVIGEFGKRFPNDSLGKGLDCKTNHFITRTARESHAYKVSSACVSGRERTIRFEIGYICIQDNKGTRIVGTDVH